MKKCTKCNRLLGLSQFSKQSKAKDGHAYWCKRCSREVNRERRMRFIRSGLRSDGVPRKNPERREKGSGGYDIEGYLKIKKNGVVKRFHRKVVEDALGRELKSNEVVHHIDGDKSNNNIENLALMPASIHSRLHESMNAFYECGDPFKRKCHYCKEYDKIENMICYRSSNSFRHRKCQKEYHAKWYLAKKKERICV